MKHNSVRKIIRKVISEMFINEEDYFEPTISNDIKRFSNRYEGRNVVWYGDPDQMIVISKDNVEGMWGNIYDPDKMEYLVDLIQNHEDKIEIECSYGIGSIYDLTNIIEEQEAVYQDRFSIDYEGKQEAATTGDQELDTYLGNEDYMEENNMLSLESVNEFFQNYKASIAKKTQTPETLREMFNRLEIDENNGEDYKDEGDYDAFKEFIRLEVALAEAQENEDGSFNEFMVQLRDGHHRVMGAIASGEKWVCVNLDKEDIEKYKGYYNKVH